jgi:hypothetical protein
MNYWAAQKHGKCARRRKGSCVFTFYVFLRILLIFRKLDLIRGFLIKSNELFEVHHILIATQQGVERTFVTKCALDVDYS